MAIYKDKSQKNKYIFGENATQEELEKVFKLYSKVRCIICNSRTARNFSAPNLTINNKMEDGVFFINGYF